MPRNTYTDGTSRPPVNVNAPGFGSAAVWAPAVPDRHVTRMPITPTHIAVAERTTIVISRNTRTSTYTRTLSRASGALRVRAPVELSFLRPPGELASRHRRRTLRRLHRAAASHLHVSLLAVEGRVEAGDLGRIVSTKRDDQCDKFQQRIAGGAAIHDRREDGDGLDSELRRVAKQQAVRHAVQALLRKHSGQERTHRAPDAMRRDNVERVVELRLRAPQQAEVTGNSGD